MLPLLQREILFLFLSSKTSCSTNILEKTVQSKRLSQHMQKHDGPMKNDLPILLCAPSWNHVILLPNAHFSWEVKLARDYLMNVCLSTNCKLWKVWHLLLSFYHAQLLISVWHSVGHQRINQQPRLRKPAKRRLAGLMFACDIKLEQLKLNLYHYLAMSAQSCLSPLLFGVHCISASKHKTIFSTGVTQETYSSLIGANHYLLNHLD